MPRELDLALVFSPDPWVEELHRHVTNHGGARIRHLVMDPALALEETYDVLVVGHRWPSLTRGLVDDLHVAGRRVLGVHDPADPAAPSLLEAIGVDGAVALDEGAVGILAAVAALAPATPVERRRDPTPAPVSSGAIVALGGPAGTGTTEVAVACAHRCRGAVLVDADEVAPSVAVRLGLPIEPNLRSALEAIEHDPGALAPNAQRLGRRGPDAIVGLPNVGAWDQVPAGAFRRLLRALAGPYRTVLVDTAAPLDDVGSPTRGRYALARAALVEADAVVAVADGSPVGAVRLLGWLAEARALTGPGVPVHVVWNRGPRDRSRRAQLDAELDAAGPVVGAWHLPDDRRVTRAAWAGTPVADGPFSRSLRPLADRIAVAPRRSRLGAGAG